MGTRAIVTLVLLAAVLLAAPAANSGEQTDGLIQLLQDKGTITRDEAAALKKGAKPDAPPATVQKPLATGAGVEPARPEEWMKNINVTYDKGLLVKTKEGNFSLLTNVYLQEQFNYQYLENSPDKTTFTTRRTRLVESGNAFYPWLKFFVQVTLETSVALRDAYVFASYYKSFVPQVGQFKVPFDREFLTSGFNLQLIERSIASAEFSLQRDIGLQISGFPLGNFFEYRAGIFNGSGANQDNVNNKYMYISRLVFTPFGPVPYSQAALETPTKPLLAIGAAGAFMPDLAPGERRTLAGPLGNTSEVPVKSDVYQFTGDLAFKFLDFSFEGGYHYRMIDPQLITRFGRQTATGYFAQAGYFIVPKHFEIAGRYSYVNPDNPVTAHSNDQEELTGGVSYYFKGHPLKLQANFTYLHSQGARIDSYDKVVRSQITLMF